MGVYGVVWTQLGHWYRYRGTFRYLTVLFWYLTVLDGTFLVLNGTLRVVRVISLVKVITEGLGNYCS